MHAAPTTPTRLPTAHTNRSSSPLPSLALLNLLPPTSSPRFQLPTLPSSQVPNSITGTARSTLGCIAVLIRAAMPPQYRRPPSRHRGTGGDSVSIPHSGIRLWGADGHLGRSTLAFRRHGTTNGRARHLIDPGLRRAFTPRPPWDTLDGDASRVPDGAADQGDRTVVAESASVSPSGKDTRVGMIPSPAPASTRKCQGLERGCIRGSHGIVL